ncbi:MAG: electron transfer flavoprotein beta subunit/FixA family protein [Propionibacteriaceae bacterium]|jgi:electron transfer flavoprotein beta subunit|nr:electron transfer flavoprotein beta subunit/FixA family protein [Propionibacteriaceae bacterium]
MNIVNIVVAYKYAPDPQEATVSSDGTVDFSRAKAVVSDYDAVAIGYGRRLATACGATLVGVCVGGPQSAKPVATKAALSRGLDRVVVVADDELETAGSTRTAQAIAAVVSQLGDVALVLAGDSSMDVAARMTPSVLAGLLGWPMLSDVETVALADGSAALERLTPQGVQSITVALPAVVSLTSEAWPVKPPGMKDLLAAGKKPVEIKSVADLGLTLADEGTVVSRAKLGGSARLGVVIDTSDPAAAAATLVEALRAAGALSEGGLA